MANLYLTGLKKLIDGTIDWDTTDIRVLLVSSSYTFSAAHEFVSSVVAAEIANAGYARQSVASRTAVVNSTVVEARAANPTFAALGAGTTPAYAIVYVYNAADASASLIACCALTTPPAPNGGDYTIDWSGVNNVVFQLANS